MAAANRVKETSTTTGTGALTLAGAATGFQSFNAAFGVGPSFRYCCSAGAEWEVGIGHLSGASTLVRDAVEQSSNANALVSFSAGTKDVVQTWSRDNAIAALNAAGILGSLTLI
jgi:hypothetical protein